jgi:hypothetical protein
MKQNKYFSLKRFTLLLKNDWLINQKIYLFTVIGLALAIYGLSYFLMYNSRNFSNSQYTGLFLFYLMGMGAIIGMAFPALTDHIKKSNYLLVPGSIFEKFMVQFFIRIVLFIPLGLILFWVATHLAKASMIPNPATGFDPVSQIQDFHFSKLFNENLHKLDRSLIALSIFSIASILFAGSTFFNRFALVKTLIITALTTGAFVLSLVLFSHIFYPAETHGFEIKIPIYKVWKDIVNIQLLICMIGGLTWLFFLPLAYFKLKEKEV